MSQTGSTYARRWPISWGPRLRIALVAGVLLATMAVAHAEWGPPRSVNGTPNDVKVWAPGVFSVATSTGAYLFQGDGGVVTIPASGGYAGEGTRLTNTGCFVGFFKDATAVVTPLTCPQNLKFSPFPAGNTELSGVKIAESGGGYALGFDSTNIVTALSFSPSESTTWGFAADLGDTSSVSMGVMTQGGMEHALVGFSGQGGTSLSWFGNGTRKGGPYLLSNPSPYSVQSIDLFNAGSTNPTALFGFADKLYRGTLSSGMGVPFLEVPLPTPPGEVVAVDVNTDAGSMYGDGFGMALVQHDGGVSLLSAMPAGQAQGIGAQWQVNSTFDGGVVVPRYLSCQGAQTCVLALKQGPPGNLFVYTNKEAPTFTSAEGTSLPEQTTLALPVPIRVSDGDGDAVRVSVNGGQQSVLTVIPTEVKGGVDLKVSAGPVCANTRVPIDIAASDGWQPHDQLQRLYFDVIHTSQASPPGVDIQPRNFAQAGSGEQLTITAASPPATPCTLSGFTWSKVTQDAPALGNDTGSTTTFTAPTVLCDPRGAFYYYQVVGHDDAGVDSVPGEFAIQVLPWGLPEKPFAVDPEVNLEGGQSHDLIPEAIHQCKPDAGYPGVDTVWEIADGGRLPSNVRLETADGQPVTGSSAATPTLHVETDACGPAANLTLDVRHYPRDGTGLVGPASRVHVNVAAGQSPLEDAKLQVSQTSVAADLISGTTSATNLDCVEERGGVDVLIRLTHDDGSLIKEGTFSLGAGWALPIVPAVCGGQIVNLEGELQARSGPQPTVPPRFEDRVDVPPAEINLQPVDPSQLMTSCGGGAVSATLTQPLPEGPCASLPLLWERVGGLELINPTHKGPTFDLTTKETEFGELIGQVVEMKVTPGTRDESARVQSIQITTNPFITMDRLIENAVGADTDLIGVSVELHNHTECVVGSVDHAEHLVGADYVPDSARFNDVPIEKERVKVEGEWVTFQGLRLEGEPNGTGRLTYVVRPRLLGKTEISGETKVRNLTVSQSVQVPVSECGCEGGGSGFAALGLAGLAAVLRRRRAR